MTLSGMRAGRQALSLAGVEGRQVPMIQNFDAYLFHAVNAFSGNRFLDSLAQVEEATNLLKGGLFMAVYYWLWFEMRGRQQQAHRKILIAMLMASFAGLCIARTLAHIVPFRVRPLFADPLYHVPSITVSANYELWNSFPSDTAALFFALAVGVFVLWRAAGILLLVYTSLWICLPRLFLGLHYPTDLIGGSLVGAAGVGLFWRLEKTRLFARWIGGPLLRLERNYPPIFYACAFPLLYEMAFLFGDVRYATRHASFLFRLQPAEIALLAIFLLAMVALVAAFFWKRARSDRKIIDLSTFSIPAWKQPEPPQLLAEPTLVKPVTALRSRRGP
jgi:membrane-associated phospholipid phosphatase